MQSRPANIASRASADREQGIALAAAGAAGLHLSRVLGG